MCEGVLNQLNGSQSIIKQISLGIKILYHKYACAHDSIWNSQ